MNVFNRFFKDESGATTIEYALMAALMTAAISAAVAALSPQLSTAFSNIGSRLTAAASNTP